MSTNIQKKRSRSRSRSRSKERKDKNRYFADNNTRFQKNKNYRRESDEGTKIMISNIPSNVPDKKINEEFENFGQVLELNIKRKSGKNYCYGYIRMKNRSSADQAIQGLINKKLGWKITLYDRENDDRKNRHRDYSRSRSISSSNSKSYSKKRENNSSNNLNVDSTYKNLSKDTDDTNNTRENRSLNEIGVAKVREVWLGNLPNNITESVLYQNFFIYGEISKIDLIPERNYAFIKYRLWQSASRAYEKAKNMTLNGNIIKISFSDSGKRRDILGDEPGYELNEKTCKLLHISLNKNCQIPPENTLKEIFKKYGYVKSIHIKANSGFRSSIYVEYSKPEEAENAINQMMNLDVTGEKRKLIGDPSCEINFYFKKKNYNFNNMQMNQNYEYNMMKNNMNNNILAANFFNKKIGFNHLMANQGNFNAMNMAQLMNFNQNQNINQGQINQNQQNLLHLMNQINQNNNNGVNISGMNKTNDENEFNNVSNNNNLSNTNTLNNFQINNNPGGSIQNAQNIPVMNQMMNMNLAMKNNFNNQNNVNSAYMNMNQSQNIPQQGNFNPQNSNLRYQMQGQNLNNQNSSMQNILMKNLLLQNNQNPNNSLQNFNMNSNLYNQMHNQNMNMNNMQNYQMLMNQQQNQFSAQNQNNPQMMQNMLNLNMMNNMQTGQKENYLQKMQINNLQNIPNYQNISQSNFPLQNTNLSMQNLSNNNSDPMVKLIQNAIINLKNKSTNENAISEKNNGTNNGESDVSYGAVSVKNEFETQYSLEDENLKQLWSGFLTKNKKDKVCVDAYQIRHECSHFFTSEFNLNVSHRTAFDEIMKRPIIGVIAFSPQNETQCENFLEYINYFQEKDRAGVVNFKSQATMYIVPPGEFSRKFYQNPKKHLLGIFVDSSVDVDKYVDMNQLKLPPPVISSSEKKLLLKQQKNQKIPTSNNNIGNISEFRNALEGLNFGTFNNPTPGNIGSINSQQNEYEIFKNMSNEEKEVLMRFMINSNKPNE